jgi:hypothetical protein
MLLVAVLAVSGCSDDDDNPATPLELRGSVRFHLKHVVGDQDLEFNDILFTNAFGNQFSVTRLQYYISNIEIHGPDGNVERDHIQYVDANLGKTMEFQLDDIPAAHYDQIAFTFGLDEDKNRNGALPNTPENANMQWPDNWGGGYHYMKLEGKYIDSKGSEDGYPTHTGRFKADHPDSAAHHHHFQVTLGLDRTVIENGTMDVEISMDINEWYANPNVIDLAAHSDGIMTNTPMQDLLEENGASVFDLEVMGK